MNKIGVICDSDLGYEGKRFNRPTHRFASRGLVFNEIGQIAILNKSNKNEYKLPGGGIEKNETKEEAFRREVLEETGCEVTDIEFLGVIEELKSHTNFVQTSYVFKAIITKNHHRLFLSEKELSEGGRLIFLDIHDALKTMKDCLNHLVASSYESVYMTEFIVYRDIKILEFYLNN